MKPEYDVIIIGSGPAGVSAAFPLLEKGLTVLMVDGGFTLGKSYNNENYLALRENDKDQWKWMLGEDFHALKMLDAVSPKLRVPALSYVFEKFSVVNNIKSENFVSIGSLSTGGLSNAWGAGVARFSKKDLAQFPFSENELDKHYENVSKRIGLSGKCDDDLSEYFSVDSEAMSALPIDEINSDFLKRYKKHQNSFSQIKFKLGRSRVAVLSGDKLDRKACTLTGNCLWGCANRSIYSATEDLSDLKNYSNFHLKSVFVEDIKKSVEEWTVFGFDKLENASKKITATRIILAAGTLATTRFALKLLPFSNRRLNLLSSPTAAFIAWNYRYFGAARKPAFGLGQLSYTIDISEDVKAFGSTFSTTGIPMAEFARHVPLSRSVSVDILSGLLSSCVIGNVFLPGHLTKVSASLKDDDSLELDGAYTDDVGTIMKSVSSRIRKAFFKMGGIVLPGSFKVGSPGADIHYAGSLPMSADPILGQTFASGELAGVKGIYIVDGACLPVLPEKSHTLTIMANAERIGSIIADEHLAGINK